MSQRARTYVFVAFASVVLLALWPAVLMPNLIYQVVYGWRYPDVRACGDATATDYGPRAAYNRVIVELKEIDLGAEGAYSFSLCELPDEQLTFGLVLPLPERTRERPDIVGEAKSSDVGTVKVELSIIDEEGQLLFSHGGQLEEWIWGYGATSPDGAAFIYPLRLRFTPNKARNYQLELAISPGLQRVAVKAQLMASGGGWK